MAQLDSPPQPPDKTYSIQIMLKDHNEIIRNRYAKAESLRQQGVNPYVNRWVPSHSTEDIQKEQEKLIADQASVRAAGRVMAIRHMGKASFFHMKDGLGQVQVYIKKGTVPEADYERFREFCDMGDIAAVEGEVFITRTGELTILAKSFALLTKSVRPLPEKWHGLKDVETRYRQRYVDLIVNDDVRQTFVLRSRLLTSMRGYLSGRGYLEVETPMMQPISGGANARPFKTHHNALSMDLFLRIAPELYLKRLTVGGMEKIFEINRNFRNEGISTRHNPEFTMLELYTAYWDYRDTMSLTEEMIRHIAGEVLGNTQVAFEDKQIDLGPEFPRLSYLDAIRRYVPGADKVELSWDDDQQTALAKIKTFHELEFAGPTYQMLVDVFEQRVEPHLIQPVFITEFPKAVSPLAKSKPDDPLIAERFELYVCGMELANGYSELNDPREQYERFLDQVKAREGGDEEAHEMDEDYIRALEYGMPPASGLGVGIDRLAMVLTNSPSIRDVILFPLMKHE